MIILVMAVFAIGMFYSWLVLKNRTMRAIFGPIFTVLLIGAVWRTTSVCANNTGLTAKTTTTTKGVYSALGSKSPAGVLVQSRLGSKADNYVLVYNDTADAKKPTVHGKPSTKVADIPNGVKKEMTYKVADVKKATVKVETTRWEWKNAFWRVMFGIGGQGGKLKKQVTTVTVPKNTWVVMTADQSKKLQAAQKSAAPEAQAAQQAQMKSAIEAKVAAYMQANPKATPDQVKAYTTEQTAEMTATAMKQMLSQLK